jgi:hypothetical protein
MAGSARGADARQEHRYGLTLAYHLAGRASSPAPPSLDTIVTMRGSPAWSPGGCRR